MRDHTPGSCRTSSEGKFAMLPSPRATMDTKHVLRNFWQPNPSMFDMRQELGNASYLGRCMAESGSNYQCIGYPSRVLHDRCSARLQYNSRGYPFTLIHSNQSIIRNAKTATPHISLNSWVWRRSFEISPYAEKTCSRDYYRFRGVFKGQGTWGRVSILP